MLKTLRLTLLVTPLLLLSGCEYVEPAEYHSLQKQLEETQTTLYKTQSALDRAERNQYQLHRDGSRTWRLNTATGETCLMLAPETDWKEAKTHAMACQ